MTNNHQENLEKFINFCQQNITGQERKEAQIFLDRFFQAFGYDGALEAGAKYMKNKQHSEINVLRDLIELLDLTGVVFTFDAVHCQKKPYPQLLNQVMII